MWIILALLVAIGTTVQDVQVKHLTERLNVYVVIWGWVIFSIPGLLIYLMIQGVPVIQPQFWLLLAIDSVGFTVAMIYYVKALESADLSITLPILSFTPVFMLITSPIIVKEYPSLLGIGGILLIVTGAYMLNFRSSQHWLMPFRQLLSNKGARYMLIVAVLFSLGANFDKLGVLASSPVMWMLCINVILTFFLTILMMVKVKNCQTQVLSSVKPLLILGSITAVVNVLQLTAITMTQVPYLIAVKRMSVVFSALYGFLVFKEKGFVERIVGILIMIAGVFLITFG